MATPIIFKITNAGKNAMLDAQNNGITLRLTHVAIGTGKYAPTGNKTALAGELQRWVITNGGIEPATHTVRFSSSMTASQELTAYEIGVFTDTGVLFAVTSSIADPLVKIYPDITFIASFGLALDEFDVSKITVSQDNEGALSIALMQQHLASPNPHPQYLLRGGGTGTADDLIQRIIALENRKIEPVSVGGLLLTTNNYANSAEVRAGEGYGVWTRYAEGRVPIGVGTAKDINAQSKTFTLGQIGGEYSHTLTEAEMPAHSHNVLLADAVTSGENQSISAGGGTVGNYGTDTNSVKDAGGSKPHNNMQPFIAAGIWLRLPDNYVAPTYTTYWTTDSSGNNKVTSFTETDNVYLWVEANGIGGSYPISLIDITALRAGSSSKLQYFIDANTAKPTSLVNGKNMVYALKAPDGGYFSGDIDLTVDVRYTDAVINQAKRITASTTINDTAQGTNETVFVLGVNQTTGQPKVIKTQGSNGISVVDFNAASDDYHKYLTAITLQLDNSIDPTDLFINAGWQDSTDETFIWQSMFSSDPAIQGGNSTPITMRHTVTFNADTRTLTIVIKPPTSSYYCIGARWPLQIILSSDISVVKNNSTTDRYDNVNNPIQRPFTGLQSWAVLRDS